MEKHKKALHFVQMLDATLLIKCEITLRKTVHIKQCLPI